MTATYLWSSIETKHSRMIYSRDDCTTLTCADWTIFVAIQAVHPCLKYHNPTFGAKKEPVLEYTSRRPHHRQAMRFATLNFRSGEPQG